MFPEFRIDPAEGLNRVSRLLASLIDGLDHVHEAPQASGALAAKDEAPTPVGPTRQRPCEIERSSRCFAVVETGVDPVTPRFSGVCSAD